MQTEIKCYRIKITGEKIQSRLFLDAEEVEGKLLLLGKTAFIAAARDGRKIAAICRVEDLEKIFFFELEEIDLSFEEKLEVMSAAYKETKEITKFEVHGAKVSRVVEEISNFRIIWW